MMKSAKIIIQEIRAYIHTIYCDNGDCDPDIHLSKANDKNASCSCASNALNQSGFKTINGI